MSNLLDAQAEEIGMIAKSKLSNAQMIVFNENIQTNISSLIKLHLLLLTRIDLLMSSMQVQKEHAEIVTKTADRCQQGNEPCRQKPEEQTQPPILYESKPYTYVFKGRGQGDVANCHDPFYNGLAIFQACIFNQAVDEKGAFFCYSVMKETRMLVFVADKTKIETAFDLKPKYNEICANGSGMITMKVRSVPDVKVTGRFIFKIRYDNATDASVSFEMKILTNGNKDFCHESGEIVSQASRVAIESISL